MSSQKISDHEWTNFNLMSSSKFLMLKYKGSDDYHQLRVKKENKIEISDERILEIQNNFSFILKIEDPQQIDQEKIDYFQFLEQDINTNSEIYYKILPKILPISLYPKYISFLDKTSDPRIHKIISRILVILTSDRTNALLELSKYNVLSAVDNSFIYCSKYVNSINSSLQIITNFIDDPNDQVSLYAHNLYNIEYLFKILQYVRGSIKQMKSNNPENREIEENEKIIINKWIKCLFASLDRYPNDIKENQVIIIFIELIGYLNFIQEDLLLSQRLCDTIFRFLESDLIHFSDFNLNGYQKLIHKLSKMDDINVKVSAFYVIGKLISINRFTEKTDFSNFFEIVKNANQATDENLLASSIYVCNAFLVNNISAEDAFNATNNDVNILLQIYYDSNFKIKKEMVSLFSSFISYLFHCKIDVFIDQNAIIVKIVDCVLDFVESADPKTFDEHPLRKLFESIDYICSTNKPSIQTIQNFIGYVMDKVTYIRDLNIDNVSEMANNFIYNMNKLHSRMQNQENAE